MIERYGGPGDGGGRITIPMANVSALVAASWFDFSCDGTAHLDVWFQKKGVGISEAHYDVTGPLDLFQLTGGIPNDTTMITYHVVKATGPWSLTIELKAK